ncbi:MAG: Unknown protein [uncultured Sulfurovum sp.]|uniref:DUF1501 domain-containing protein n=1 Tax=uncultured Sulfurovum sp. TaxID=269237 RepID=A0A6S6SFJ2_9BACT|nr:MAG: Unknown protein [uncultured Sulfurovum sp.]
MERRNFLKGSLGVLGSTMMTGVFSTKLFGSALSKRKKLVVLFNHGGNDGINMLVPYGDPYYNVIRPNLAILPPDGSGSNAISLGENGRHDGIDFGLHPSMSGLKNIWDDGNIAFMPATHCGKNPNRSHFYQFSFLGEGKYTTDTHTSDGYGWVSRYMNNKYLLGPQNMQTFDFTAGYFNVFNGWETLGMKNPASAYYGMSKTHATQYIDKVLPLGSDDSSVEAQVSKLQSFTISQIRSIENYDFSSTPQNGALYPSSSLGTQLSQAATMFRNTPELEIIFINKGGWDTHSNQAVRHPTLLGDLSNSLYAFYTDMGTAMEDTTVLVLSEFGRTAHENASSNSEGELIPGTDHGHAFCSFVIGGQINGGIYGGWPGLNPETQLVSKRFLAEKVDYRDVISECLSLLEGGDPDSAFQGFTRTPIGFA